MAVFDNVFGVPMESRKIHHIQKKSDLTKERYMSKQGNIQFGMPTLVELESLSDTMQLCQDLGLSFVEINMNLPQYQIERLEDTAYLKSLQDKYQLSYTIHLDENMNICDFNQAVARAYSDTVKRAICVAKEVEIPVLNMHMNHGVHFTLPDRKVQLFEKYFDVYMNSWRSFRDMCESAIGSSDIKICIENTDGFREYEKSAITYLLKSEAFALTWDIGHSHGIGNADVPFILEHEDKLRHFHIHDGLKRQNHMVLGTGEIDIKQRLAIAQKHGCRCVIETKTIDALKESVAWLKNNAALL